MYQQPPSRERLHDALIAFSGVYARRHRELSEQVRRQQMSREEMSRASRRMMAIKVVIEAHWLGAPFALPDEYRFEPRQLTDLIQAEIAGCQQVRLPRGPEDAASIETIPGRERLVEALALIDALLMSLARDDDDDNWLFGELPLIRRRL
jgi:hypothetical protein